MHRAQKRRFGGEIVRANALMRGTTHGTSNPSETQGFRSSPIDEDAPIVTDTSADLAAEVLARCDVLARFTESPGKLTRTFLSEPMRHVHATVGEWMREATMNVRIDAISNIIGHYPAARADAPLFLIGSHLDTVPDAGNYDGILGVLLAIAAVKHFGGRRLPFAIDVLGFSEEEGIRFRTAYLGSRAVCGCFDPSLLNRVDAAGMTMAKALRDFGLDPERIATAAYPPDKVLGYLEAHIEQGPVLESQNLPLGIVEAIIGQSRFWLTFEGMAGHAGTQPMELRRDALAAAAEFVLAVERDARTVPGLRATVGSITALPGAVNVVPGAVRLSLDIRHADDAVREQAIVNGLAEAEQIGSKRDIAVRIERGDDHAAVRADPRLTNLLGAAAEALGHRPLRMVSGAGHDAAVMAALAPMAMLFLRSPGGISHHPDESVLPGDVRAALDVLIAFLEILAGETT
jgi:allantoate deiminase